ncbi:alpha,alpha-trehalose-phosphate synthase (UDP-forming) [Halomarina oriensis]|uniref:Trehalose-6-phosphate synthase n=1 Tax=Halomarina oriensis TaxID=671145 RepID=A0A6B0GT82_9EURY|nr:trehalose-6-phosphate synthase [Halomarina oriensis]MWG34918.1 trehalose-6-phosphate synthase [Halomarina oriensis]
MTELTGAARTAVADERDERARVTDDLFVVSNRQPYRHRYDEAGNVVTDRPVGGLTAGLDPVVQRVDGTWVAWGDGDADRAVVDGDDCVRVPPDDPSYTLRRVWLDDEDVEGYYYGFANQVLWPLSHGLVETMAYDDDHWAQYRAVNETFADAVAEGVGPDSVVWFQDYHFGLAPRHVREQAPDATLLQFWHIPWPDWETFRACPVREALLDGLLANDLLGFHVPRYCEAFLDCVAACFDDATVDDRTGEVHRDGETTRVRAFPMGVDVDTIEAEADACTDEEWTDFAREIGVDPDVTLSVGVDRLDYTKGIPERLDALERFFEDNPEWRGELTHVQKLSESRSRIPAYGDVADRVEEAIERINDRFGTDDWRPVVRVDSHLSTTRLYGLYRHADIAIVSPIRDGMNLVAKEYIAAQTGDPGVLLLSELAGAEDELGEFALSIAPYDTASFAEHIETAVTMPEEDRRERMANLRAAVAANDIEQWMSDIFGEAQAVRQAHDR